MAESITPSFLRRIFQSPLVLRELRVACRSWKLVAILSVYLLIQCAIFTITVAAFYNQGVYENPTKVGRLLFIIMSVVQIVVTMMVFPAFSATSIASEHEKKSFDLLLLTPLSAWEIAIGKFIAAGIQASVFLIATIPLFALANLFGGINPMAFFMVLLILVLFSVFISFVGVYASSLQKKVVPAAIITYLMSIFIGIILLVGLIT
ncbi:MAG: ABC transporter permease, partial [Planctomycetota bacterium]